jgi:hypothetical protein
MGIGSPKESGVHIHDGAPANLPFQHPTGDCRNFRQAHDLGGAGKLVHVKVTRQS